MQPNTNLKTTLDKYPLLSGLFKKITLRTLVQFVVAVLMILAAVDFYQYAEYIKYGNSTIAPDRPPMVEGFLPVAAIVAFKALLATGEIDPIHPAGLIIFIATVVTGWIFRRALCSWICPIGTLSEQLSKLGRRIIGRNLKLPKWLDIGLLVLKYGVFIFIFNMFFLMPANEAVSFMQIPYYAISDLKMFDFFMGIEFKGLMFITTLLILSTFINSFWCRYLCPYGTVLGILGFFSPITLTRNSETCINCHKCNTVCPNSVDVEGKKKFVATTECTGCTSCVSVCPKPETLQFKLFNILPIKPLYFSIAFLIIFFGIIYWAKFTGHWESSMTVNDFARLHQMMSSFGGPMQ